MVRVKAHERKKRGEGLGKAEPSDHEAGLTKPRPTQCGAGGAPEYDLPVEEPHVRQERPLLYLRLAQVLAGKRVTLAWRLPQILEVLTVEGNPSLKEGLGPRVPTAAT